MPSDLFTFGSFELDPSARRLTRDGEPITLSARQFDLLHLLVAHAGRVLPKDVLVERAWDGVAVTDNSLEKAISGLRQVLSPDARVLIETQARRGYRFAADVQRVERREPSIPIDALLAPHRAWIEGRAALETLEGAEITRARAVFEAVLAQAPDQASAHVGLANACVMQFEMTRVERVPDVAALAAAETHAREACRLDPRYGEAWATLGFVLDRTGHRRDALASSRRAVSLEPDNWRHHLRLGYVSWGEERLREAGRTLALLPGFPLAHWLAATVHVARQAFDEAERELRAGLAVTPAAAAPHRFTTVALHWLMGLLLLARGEGAAALEEFRLELAAEHLGQLYAREVCANTWYAIGALHWHQGNREAAAAAFTEALERVPMHPMAHVGRRLAQADSFVSASTSHPAAHRSPESALAHAAAAFANGDPQAAVRVIEDALAAAPDGSALWTLPVDPLLRVLGDVRWAPSLAQLQHRSA